MAEAKKKNESKAVTVSEEKSNSPKPNTEPVKPREIMLRPDGSLDLKDNQDALTFASMLVQKGMAPRGLENGYQVLAVFQAGAELGMTPYMSLTCFSMINGTPALHTDGPKALVDASGKLEYFEEWLFDKDGNRITASEDKVNLAKPFGSYTKMKRKGLDGFKEQWYTLDDAEAAGLYIPPEKRNAERKKKRKPWDIHTLIMLQRRPRSFVMKTLFADVIKGTKIAEYDYDALPEKGFVKNYREDNVVEIEKERDVNEVLGDME